MIHMSHPELTRSDLRILDLVQEHGDLSAAELGERLGMSASTCWRRLSRLIELGVIKRRVAVLDREKVGLSVLVFSHVKLAGHGRDALLKFEQAVRAHPEILECYTLMGETDFLLRIVAVDWDAYQRFLTTRLTAAPNVTHVKSSLAIRTCKNVPGVPISDE